MKLPTGVIKTYREIHGWVGIVSGLALFIAFFAGAITMFASDVQRWASPPSRLAAAPSLSRTPELIARVLEQYPEAGSSYEINLAIDAAHPARLSWTNARGEAAEHGGGTTYYAALGPDGQVQVETAGPSSVAGFIDVLHQQIGLPFDHEISMPIMGIVAMLYFVALVSGLIVLLPSLVSDLFALRLGKNVKRMWLDVHNLLGIFSLPFHIIMALTCVVFAFHDQFYAAQHVAFGGAGPARREIAAPAGPPDVMAPAQVVVRLRDQAPAFTPVALNYGMRGGEPFLRVMGSDARYGLRGPDFGIAQLNPRTGAIANADYMPGRQDRWSAVVTSFFALHFGNFGGAAIRWAYFLLGMAGAFLFYTGNLLWVESRRKRERRSGAVEQTRATRVLAALTVGVPAGCIAGVCVTLAAAKPLGLGATLGLHSAIFYAVFLAFVGWSLVRGAARSGYELGYAAAASTLTIPLASLMAIGQHPDSVVGVDITALGSGAVLWIAALSARRRSHSGPPDSVWAKAGDKGVASPA